MPGPAVLIVDDNRELARSLKRHLASKGIEAVTEAGLEDALSRLSEDQPRVVLAAAGASGGKGMELARRIRDLPGDRPQVLILSTARPTARLGREAKAAGAVGVVPRLAGPRVVADRLRPLLRAPAGGTPGKPLPGVAVVPVASGPDLTLTPMAGRTVTPIKQEVMDALSSVPRRTPVPGAGPHADDYLFDPSLESGPDPSGSGATSSSDADFHHQRGRYHLLNGDHQAALSELSRAKALDSTNPVHQAYWAHAKRLSMPGRPDPDGNLADTLRMARMMDPNLVEPHLFLGLLLEDASRPQDARDCFQQVLKLQPGHAEARVALERLSKLEHSED